MAAQGHARAPIDGKLRSIEWRVRRIYPRSTGKTRQHRTQLDLRAVQPHRRLRQRSPAAQSRLQPGLCSTVRPRFGDRSEARIFPTNRAHRRLSAQPLDHRDRGPVLGAARLARPAAPGRLVWRDRKGLFGNPFSLLTNLLFIYGILLWIGARIASVPLGARALLFPPRATGHAWHSSRPNCRPLRLQRASTVHSSPSVCQSDPYVETRSIPWRPFALYTDTFAHAFYGSRPSTPTAPAPALTEHKRRLGEILAGSGYASEDVINKALNTLPAGHAFGRASGPTWQADRGRAL